MNTTNRNERASFACSSRLDGSALRHCSDLDHVFEVVQFHICAQPIRESFVGLDGEHLPRSGSGSEEREDAAARSGV
jgi:hypothetical protein